MARNSDFGHEDRDQITELFVETFKQLSISVNVSKNQYATPEAIVGKSRFLFMTDAVTKNLGIEDMIPNALGSNHHPYHLLY